MYLVSYDFNIIYKYMHLDMYNAPTVYVHLRLIHLFTPMTELEFKLGDVIGAWQSPDRDPDCWRSTSNGHL